MKLNTIVNAGPSLQKLILQDVPIKTAYALAMLIDKLNPHLSFYGNEITKRYGNTERMEELANLDIPDLENIQKIPFSLAGSITLSAADIKRLEPFVDFVDVEERQPCEKK